MKADVAVADLHEERASRRRPAGAHDAAGGQRERDAGAGPADVLEKIARFISSAFTMTVPCMYGCISQKYANVPGVGETYASRNFCVSRPSNRTTCRRP